MTQFSLVRVDDRLLHGQVALGWREALRPETFWIVDDRVASDQFVRGIYEGAAPEGTLLRVDDVAGFLKLLSPAATHPRTVLLIGSLTTVDQLDRGGFRPPAINLGGLHHRPGAKRYLDYLYLTDEDLAIVTRLIERGIDLFAQDLPTSPRQPLARLLELGPRG